MYSKEERIEIVTWYQSGNSFRNVRDMFSLKYPYRPIPSIATIHSIVKQFKSEGCIVNCHKKRNKMCHVLTEEMKFNILCFVEENHNTCLSRIASEFAVSKTSVFKLLKEFKYKPYKYNNHQMLYEEDKIRRTDFCEILFNLFNENEAILQQIVFTDEASFSLNGSVNSQNYRYWSRTNDHVQNLINNQNHGKVNVWIGLTSNALIGPFFIDGNLTASKFLHLLQNQIVPSIRNLNFENAWFQMDGAPPHSTNAVTNFLNEKFPNRWIGRYGTIAWPPRSPDLTPNDFFLWGYLKSKIYNNELIENVEELKTRIRTACNELNTLFLRNAVEAFRNRLAFCLEREGEHFEHLL